MAGGRLRLERLPRDHPQHRTAGQSSPKGRRHNRPRGVLADGAAAAHVGAVALQGPRGVFPEREALTGHALPSTQAWRICPRRRLQAPAPLHKRAVGWAVVDLRLPNGVAAEVAAATGVKGRGGKACQDTPGALPSQAKALDGRVVLAGTQGAGWGDGRGFGQARADKLGALPGDALLPRGKRARQVDRAAGSRGGQRLDDEDVCAVAGEECHDM